jgi:hypothetical protein
MKNQIAAMSIEISIEAPGDVIHDIAVMTAPVSS